MIDLSIQEKEIFKLFIDESLEQLQKVEEDLLKLENGYDAELIQEIFRMLHSIKGSSLSMGFQNLSEFMHDVEDLLDKVRKEQIVINEDILDLLYECSNKAKEIIEVISQGEKDDIDTSELRERIKNFTGTEYKPKTNKQFLDKFNIAEHELLIMDDAAKRGENVFVIKVEIQEDAVMKAMKAFLIINNFKNIGQVLRVWPENYETIEEDEFDNEFKAILITAKSKEIVIKNIDVAGDIKNIIIEEFKGKEIKNPDSKIVINVRKNLKENLLFRQEKRDYIRVNISKLDRILKTIGELVVNNGKLSQIIENLKTKYKKDPDIKDLMLTMQHLHLLGIILQESIMDVRVYTVENIFNKLEKMVKDLEKRRDKQINFVTIGKTIELDRGILEEIVDPLVHLVRNSVDHGIEPVEERIAKGKDPQGTITLRACYQENHVVIEVSDDGKGLDLEKIKQKALEKRLITVNEAKTMPEQELYNLIFLPGFSTAEVVTDLSGRGVGMDVVKTNIERLNGVIEVKSKKDKGCRFTIKLPLTLAIIQALLIKEGMINFAIPLTSIVETVRLTQQEFKNCIKKVKGEYVYAWRDQVIPVVDLGRYFDINCRLNNDKVYLVVAGFAEKYICFIVEKLLSEKQILIKNIGEYIGKGKLLGDIKGICGVSILGNGEFAYVIDVLEILKSLNSNNEIKSVG